MTLRKGQSRHGLLAACFVLVSLCPFLIQIPCVAANTLPLSDQRASARSVLQPLASKPVPQPDTAQVGTAHSLIEHALARMSKAWERRPVRYPLLQQDPHCLTLSPCALLCCSPVSPPPSPAPEVPAPAPVAAEDEAAESNDAASLAPAPAPESAGFVMQESLTTGTEQAGQDIALAVPEPVDAPAASSAATASSGQVRRRGLGLVPGRGRDGTCLAARGLGAAAFEIF